MKPVVERVIDKNGDETTRFHPTGSMLLFAMKKAEFPGLGDGEVSERAGIDPQLPGRWAKKYGTLYLEWLEEFCEQTPFGQDAALLERVGMVQAIQSNNFSYWKEMAKVKGVIKEEAAPTHLTINTDFSAVFIGDFNDARRKILEAYRGVVNPGGSRVVDAPVERLEDGAQGPGAGTSPLQAGSVEVAHPLGEDRGHPEQGIPVPAVPRKSTP